MYKCNECPCQIFCKCIECEPIITAFKFEMSDKKKKEFIKDMQDISWYHLQSIAFLVNKYKLDKSQLSTFFDCYTRELVENIDLNGDNFISEYCSNSRNFKNNLIKSKCIKNVNNNEDNHIEIIHSVGVPDEYKNDVLFLLKLCDKEFVPNLSLRNSSVQQDFLDLKNNTFSLNEYFKSICMQENYFLIQRDHVIGFMSFIKDYSSPLIKNNSNIYISTVIVHPSFRNKGLCKKLYKHMLTENSNKNIYTRTWSENNSHINILLSMGFKEYLRIENDREKNIDTVYFVNLE